MRLRLYFTEPPQTAVCRAYKTASEQLTYTYFLKAFLPFCTRHLTHTSFWHPQI